VCVANANQTAASSAACWVVRCALRSCDAATAPSQMMIGIGIVTATGTGTETGKGKGTGSVAPPHRRMTMTMIGMGHRSRRATGATKGANGVGRGDDVTGAAMGVGWTRPVHALPHSRPPSQQVHGLCCCGRQVLPPPGRHRREVQSWHSRACALSGH
jgi:hypothetical protein